MSKYIYIVHIVFITYFTSSCQYFQKKDNTKELISSSPIEKKIQYLSDKLLDSPKNARLYFERGKLYWSQQENERALNDFYKMTTYDSTKAIYYETLAEFFVDNMNVERAIQALDYAIKIDPYSAKYHVMQGKYSLYIKKYQDAINHLNNALKRDIHNPEAYFYKGYVFKELNQKDKAISSFITASEQDPTWDAPYEHIGEIYASQKNDLALKYYDNAAKANPKNTSALMSKAYYLKQSGRIEEARTVYEMIVNQYPQNADAIYSLGVLSYDKKDYTKALQQFEICIKVDPAHASAFYMIGKTQLALGRSELAKTAFLNASHFDTTFVEAKAELLKLK